MVESLNSTLYFYNLLKHTIKQNSLQFLCAIYEWKNLALQNWYYHSRMFSNKPTEYGNVTRASVNLTITNYSREDTGVYTCSANYSIGSDRSNVSITVQCEF